MRKHYLATFLLGRGSVTDDVDGQVTMETNPRIPSLDDVQNLLPQFIGEIQQTPPAYSAVKVKGRRAYDLARRGEAVELQSRTVTVATIRIRKYEYPEIVLEIECGSGTYVRSIGRDMATSLGTSAVMSALERKGIGRFHIDDAVSFEQLDPGNWQQSLLPPAWAVPALPRVVLSEDELRRLSRGIVVRTDSLDQVTETEAAAFNSQGDLMAILASRREGWSPVRNFMAALKSTPVDPHKR